MPSGPATTLPRSRARSAAAAPSPSSRPSSGQHPGKARFVQVEPLNPPFHAALTRRGARARDVRPHAFRGEPMAVLRTPESCFANVPDYPFAPHYVDLAKAIGRTGEARMHYVDEGRGQPILCLHGEPSWSFLYRRMIPTLATRGR